jgi:Bacteriophage head to tail connecting protein.
MWDADAQDSNSKAKRDAIVNYMSWTIGQDRFKQEMAKCVLDYIDDGNCFGTVEWVDERSNIKSPPTQVGYVGPTIRRIAPTDIVFNPTAPTFLESPKIIRSLVSIGELKQILESQSSSEDKEAWQDLYDYLIELRTTVRNSPGVDVRVEDSYYQMDGFTNFRAYLESDVVEILTFYGDIFDWDTKELLHNHKIMVVDRHKIISKKPNPSYFGFPPIFHVGWRVRQDNLWAMGPLHNLVGLQYRVDHIENLKADVFDLLTFPPLKIRGYVEDFTWGPFEKIYVGDEGDVEILSPPFQILQANVEIANYTQTMEEMAGSPKEAMGFRTPGEKTAFEVQRLENAAARIFQSKVVQFEEQFVERLMNAMLELARRNLSSVQSIAVFDDEFKIQTFQTLTPQDITGAGRIKPLAARHFAERAEMVQNVNNFYMSGPGQDPEVRQHISSIAIAQLTEELLNWQDFRIVQPYVRLSEQAEAAKLTNVAQEQVLMESQTSSGLNPDDVDLETP